MNFLTKYKAVPSIWGAEEEELLKHNVLNT